MTEPLHVSPFKAFSPNLPFWFALILLGCGGTINAAQTESSSLNSEYMAVLRTGDARKIEKTLDDGAAINARDAAGNTPLIYAAAYGDFRCVRLLLDRGAEVNTANAAGATALMRAADDYDKIRALVAHGADVNTRSRLGNTALLLAARRADSHRAVEFLLSHGANAKDTNNFGGTALMAAVAGGDKKTVRLLLNHGADVNAQPAPNQMGFLLGGGRDALMWAAYRGDVAMLKLLVEAGANVNSIGGFGSPLGQAAWADQVAAAKFLIENGAKVNQPGPQDGYTPLLWAAGTENRDPSVVNLLLAHGADPNHGGGEQIDAFLGTLQTPLMLARRRGEGPVLAALIAAGATNATADRPVTKTPPARQLPKQLDAATLRAAIAQAVAPLQETAIKSKKLFVRHASQQDCTSCHQQYLPMAALGFARRQRVPVEKATEQELIRMVHAGELKDPEVDWQAAFHPDPAYTKGYELFAMGSQELPADDSADAWVHHLSAIQGKDGRWFNNLPRPPIQSDDVGATALAIHALQRFALPGRKAQFAKQVNRGRQWLWTAKPQNNSSRAFQLLGLSWAGEPARKLQPLAKALLNEQRADGGWSQLPGTKSDAYATGQAIFALRVAAGMKNSDPAIDRGLRFLLETQLEDGTWHVRRRAFPFQPTMESGFPHGRDAWISAAATSWAVMALSLPESNQALALKQ
jgi:ankyrin repeat protein